MSWYLIDRKGEVARATIFGELAASGPTEKDFIAEIGDAPRIELTMFNAPGGCSNAGLALHDLFKSRDTTATVMGNCTSAAAVALMGAKQISMFADARLMVHAAVNHVVGDAAMMRQAADNLDRLNARISTVIQHRTNQRSEVVGRWLAPGTDTWFTSWQASHFRLADNVICREPVPPDTTGPVVIEERDLMPESEALFNDFLSAFGKVSVRNREKFAQNLQVWFASNVKQRD